MPYYDHDKNYPFAAFITNLGKYNEGELVGEWVKFPTTAEELKEVFKRIGIGQKDDFGQPYEEWFITDYDCYLSNTKTFTLATKTQRKNATNLSVHSVLSFSIQLCREHGHSSFSLASNMACTVAMMIPISRSVNSSARASSCRRAVDFPSAVFPKRI